MDDLSPRARRLVESGLIDLTLIAGSGEGGKLTSGDILHAARIMEVEQSVARIETTQPSNNGDQDPGQDPAMPIPGEELSTELAEPTQEEATTTVDEPAEDTDPVDLAVADDAAESAEDEAESATFAAVDVGGDPISVEPTAWEDYNGSSEGFSDMAREGAEQSWGEAEAHLTAMAEEAASKVDEPPLPEPQIPAPGASEHLPPPVAPPAAPPPPPAPPEIVPAAPEAVPVGIAVGDDGHEPEGDGLATPVAGADDSQLSSGDQEQVSDIGEADAPTEVMMDFGTLELVDPESVWAQGAEDFAPWFLAHSQQLGDVLGLRAGLADARQFTTKSATGVLGRDDNDEDVVVVSSKNAVADDSDLGRALGMAASSGAASVALVSAALHEDQLKALAWLNSQTKSGVKWYGIEMKVVRIADSPAAMLFDLVASPMAQQQVGD